MFKEVRKKNNKDKSCCKKEIRTRLIITFLDLKKISIKKLKSKIMMILIICQTIIKIP